VPAPSLLYFHAAPGEEACQYDQYFGFMQSRLPGLPLIVQTKPGSRGEYW